jgi:glycolate oxidase FAD binding subunit
MNAPAMTLEQGAAYMASIMGGEHVSIRRDNGQTIAVDPADVQQVGEVLRFANANRLVTVPTCGGTKLGWGNPVSPHIELSMKRLCAVREHAWQDMTCTVQAGCRWPDRAAVGGVVACNDSGALRLKYGSLRDLIIGMTVVLADGTIARTGGKVVKNVAGYDVHKLMTGSYGTLGVIAEVNFRLHPVEDHARTWTASLAKCNPLAERFREPLRALMNSQLVPSSVQMRISAHECALDVRMAGLPECLDEYDTRIESIFNGFEVHRSQENVWGERQQVFDKNDGLVLKVSVLPDEICPVSTALLQWTSGAPQITIVAQATGLMMVSVAAASEVSLALLDRLREFVDPSGGSVVVLRSPLPLKGNIDVSGPDRGTVPLMREIKRNFDPNRILNPGRFVGGI